jgi:hypothetical protein
VAQILGLKTVKYKIIITIFLSCHLASCANFDEKTEVINTVDETIALKDKIINSNSYGVINTPYANKVPLRVVDRAEKWLKSKKLSVGLNINSSNGVSLKEILKSFNRAGVRISSTLPINDLYYRGFPINPNTSADTALHILTEQLGLDYIAEYSDHGSTPYVTIIEMGTSSYRLNVPDVEAGMSIIDDSESNGGGSQGSQGGNTSSQGGSAQSGQSGQSGQGGQGGGNFLTYQSSFWKKLKEELESQMKILVPVKERRSSQQGNSADFNPSVPLLVAPPQSSDSELFNEVQVGRVTVNSHSGNITITAPRHVRKRLVAYLETLDNELNTRMIIEVKVLSVTRSLDQSKGIDISGLKSIGSKFGLNMSNNVLGNITISEASADNYFNVGADNAVAQSLLGISKVDKAFQAFLAYLETQGETQSISSLRGSTSSGKLIKLSARTNDPVLLSNTSTITSDTGSTSGGSSSEKEDNWTGVSAKITPKYDAKRGVVHNLMDIKITLDAGEKPQQQPIVAGNNIVFNTVNLKREAEVVVQTETVARAGEVIIAGGVRTLQQVDGHSGVMSIKDTILGDAFGKKTRRTLLTEYFVLVSVNVHSYNDLY